MKTETEELRRKRPGTGELVRRVLAARGWTNICVRFGRITAADPSGRERFFSLITAADPSGRERFFSLSSAGATEGSAPFSWAHNYGEPLRDRVCRACPTPEDRLRALLDLIEGVAS